MTTLVLQPTLRIWATIAAPFQAIAAAYKSKEPMPHWTEYLHDEQK
ncbi:hypothetical protein [Shimia abyssi]|uniref:Uncharacterized protein n=1 Tax=Shimia abyssi TaxID=1662395 RepID=A0A2P8FAC5_9RHOB|nr:hypothetical protein [Shimia abyssi]PSL18670.1 hypothetical protein CLV88_10955 [Shimia abyssi]